MPRVLLVTMPYMTPNLSSIALATLKPILEAAGIATDALYGSTRYPRTRTDHIFLERHGQFLFAPYIGADTETIISGILERERDDFARNCFAEERGSHIDVLETSLRRRLHREIDRAGVCLDRCLASALAHDYDVVGFSLIFETQVPAALALAQRLRQQRPGVRIVFGGAACPGAQADGMLASFPVVDVVCHGEGENVIVPLVRALRGEGALADVPGIVFRGPHGLVHNPSSPLVEDLDRLPMVDHHDFFAQLAASEWTDLPPRVFFETSRGCWWGQKHLCTFCGLNAEGLAFRAKSGERAFREIAHLYREYPAALMQATDNILHMKYFETLLPHLARLPRDPERPLQMFFEVKSNMRAEQVALMAAAGIGAAQPGIESFSDHVLALMDKGCTALGQIEYVKWLDQEDIMPVYNLLFGSPGETVADYREMMGLLSYIEHLSPPVGLTRLELMRFSPYWEHPEAFGIRNIRPKGYYRALYPDPAVDLMRLSYEFDFDHDSHGDTELQAAYREFAEAVRRWQSGHKKHQLFFLDRLDQLDRLDGRLRQLVVVDRRGGGERVDILGGVAARIFRYLDSARTFAAVAKRFPEVEPEALDALLERWRHRRWLYRSPAGKLLAVVPARHEGPRDAETVIAAARVQAPAERSRLAVVGA